VLNGRRLRACNACLLALLVSAPAMGAMNTWTTNGPPGGYVLHLGASQTDGDVLYAAYTNSLFKTTDGGLTWRSVREWHTRVAALAVDPSDGNRIYVGGTGEGLFRSDDAGSSYVQIAPGYLTLGSVAANGNVVAYASLQFDGISGTISRIHRSSDRGVTWASYEIPANFWTAILLDGSNADTMIGIGNGAAFRSLDGGVSWQDVTLSAFTPAPYVQGGIIISTTVALLATSNGIYRTTDGGDTWSRVYSAASISTIVADPTAPDAYVAAPGAFGSGGSLVRSTDQGASWSTLNALPSEMRHGMFAMRRNSSSQFVIANDDNIFVSNDAGSTWAEAVAGPATSYVTRFATSAAPNSRLFAIATGQSSALFATAADSLWERVNISGILADTGGDLLGPAAIAVKPGDPNSIVIMPRVHTAYRTDNGAASWSGPGDGLYCFAKHAVIFDPVATSTLYAQVAIDPGITPLYTPANGLYQSVDGGANWAPRSTNLGVNIQGAQLVIDPADSNRMYLAAREPIGTNSGTGGLYVSTDAGVTWTHSLVAEDIQAVEVDPSNSNRIYAASDRGLLTSNDAGATFAVNSALNGISSDPVSALAIDPTVPTTLYAATLDPFARTLPTSKSSTIVRSVDAGQTWEVLRSASQDPEWHVSKLALDPNVPSLLYAATEIRGVAEYEIAPNLGVSITGHVGARTPNTATSFDLHIDNRGAHAATNVRAETTLPAGLSNPAAIADRGNCAWASNMLTCTAAVLSPNQSINVHVEYTPTNSMALPISSTLSAHERDASPSDNVATAMAYAGEIVDLSLSINPNTARIRNGESAVYAVQVRNAGPTDASDAIVRVVPSSGLLPGAPPPGCTATSGAIECNTGALPVNASRTFSLTMNGEVAGAATVDAAVYPAAAATDEVLDNNRATSALTISAAGDLSVSVVDSVDPATVSANFQYRATVANSGPDSMSNVSVALVSSATTVSVNSTQGTCAVGVAGISCDLGTLGNGASATITVVSASSAAGSVSLHATVTSDGEDRVTTNNTAQEFTTVRTPPSSGGGGGAFDLRELALWLVALLVAAALRKRNQFAARWRSLRRTPPDATPRTYNVRNYC